MGQILSSIFQEAKKNETIYDLQPQYAQNNPSKNFLSKSMLNFMLKNASPKAYFKLIQTSKYFLMNEPPKIPRHDRIKIKRNSALYTTLKGVVISEVTDNKIWIATRVLKSHGKHGRSSYLSNFLPRVYRCDIEYLIIYNQNLNYDELKLLMGEGNVKRFNFNYNKFTHSNGDIVAIEDILSMTPEIKHFSYTSLKPYTLNSDKVAALPTFDKLVVFYFWHILEGFDIEALVEFLKKTKIIYGGIEVRHTSKSYAQKCLTAVRNAIEATNSVELKMGVISIGMAL